MAGIHFPLSGTNLIRPSSSPAPSTFTRPSVVTQNLSYWDSIYSDIESYLKKAIPIRQPISVFEPIHHLTFAPPKSTAPALCVAACEAVGGSREDAIVAASAIHLMHATIYTHDQLMLKHQTDQTDQTESKFRSRFGRNIELLTGDGIMPFGFEILARSAAGNNSEKILKVIVEITRAIGAQGMVSGEDDNVRRPAGQLDGCGAACGAILGGGSEEDVERLKRFGVYVGKIQGLLSEKSKKEGADIQIEEIWRALALKELEYFDDEKVKQISTIVL